MFIAQLVFMIIIIIIINIFDSQIFIIISEN